MAHTFDATTNIISKIQLPNNGGTYEIHDASAIHSIEELGLSAALVFKGVKATVDALPTSGNKVGDVWHVTADDCEYVWTDASEWEPLGNVHDAASSTHTHNVTVTGTNAASAVTGTVIVPTVSKTQKYLTANASAPSITAPTDKVLGEGTTVSVHGGAATNTNIKATAAGTAVGANGTAAAITGFGAHKTDSVLGSSTTFNVSGGNAQTSKMVTRTIKNPSVSAVSIPNVTGNTAVTASKVKTTGKVTAGSVTPGSAPSWSASVSNGVLSFNFNAGSHTAVTLPTVTLPTFENVDASKVTLGTALNASKVTTSDVTVATGSLASDGAGSTVATGVNAVTVTANNDDTVDAMTNLGTPTTANALTGVKVTSQPTISLATGATAGTGVISVTTGIGSISATLNKDEVDAVTSVSAAAPSITLTQNDTTSTGAVSFVSGVTIGSTSASLQNGSAAAQKWTQKTGSTGQPK